eukprot:TRINITY_DN21166_c0_g1_i1.p1 TRINITY_DN21166_c0_g1~~TRINITY_DN21166_c0_g1_i1.p1  ORF type:complete len:715 (-),score=160.20 TRINITY_DN21166_c0_g1_i1:100-2244(-)
MSLLGEKPARNVTLYTDADDKHFPYWPEFDENAARRSKQSEGGAINVRSLVHEVVRARIPRLGPEGKLVDRGRARLVSVQVEGQETLQRMDSRITWRDIAPRCPPTGMEITRFLQTYLPDIAIMLGYALIAYLLFRLFTLTVSPSDMEGYRESSRLLTQITQTQLTGQAPGSHTALMIDFSLLGVIYNELAGKADVRDRLRQLVSMELVHACRGAGTGITAEQVSVELLPGAVETSTRASANVDLRGLRFDEAAKAKMEEVSMAELGHLIPGIPGIHDAAPSGVQVSPLQVYYNGGPGAAGAVAHAPFVEFYLTLINVDWELLRKDKHLFFKFLTTIRVWLLKLIREATGISIADEAVQLKLSKNSRGILAYMTVDMRGEVFTKDTAEKLKHLPLEGMLSSLGSIRGFDEVLFAGKREAEVESWDVLGATANPITPDEEAILREGGHRTPAPAPVVVITVAPTPTPMPAPTPTPTLPIVARPFRFWELWIIVGGLGSALWILHRTAFLLAKSVFFYIGDVDVLVHKAVDHFLLELEDDMLDNMRKGAHTSAGQYVSALEGSRLFAQPVRDAVKEARKPLLAISLLPWPLLEQVNFAIVVGLCPMVLVLVKFMVDITRPPVDDGVISPHFQDQSETVLLVVNLVLDLLLATICTWPGVRLATNISLGVLEDRLNEYLVEEFVVDIPGGLDQLQKVVDAVGLGAAPHWLNRMRRQV